MLVSSPAYHMTTYSGMMMVNAAPTRIPIPSTDIALSRFPDIRPTSTCTARLTRRGRLEYQRQTTDQQARRQHADALEQEDEQWHGESKLAVQVVQPVVKIGPVTGERVQCKGEYACGVGLWLSRRGKDER